VTLSGVTSIPTAPSNSSNWAQPWSYSNEKDTFGTFRGEYDFTSTLTGWVAAGFRHSEEANSLANLYVTNSNGNGYTYRFDNTREDDVRTAETGLRGKAETFGIGHDVVFSANYFELEKKNAYKMDYYNRLSTNMYTPSSYSVPAWSGSEFGGNDLDDPSLSGRTHLSSYALGDTLAFWDKTVLVTLGARYQKLSDKGYAYNTGILSTEYSKERISPVLGVVYKVTPEISLYGNYIEGLSQGGTAPSSALNYGEILKPYVTEQKEVGIKYDNQTLGGSLALFTTSKPRGVTNSAGYYVDEGEDRHRGAELMLYGEVTQGLKLLGGITVLDTEQVSTGSATTEGKRVIGVPEKQANIGVDWSVPGMSGLSFDARLIATGEVYANSTNTLSVPGWERVDVGAKYLMVVDKQLVTLRARVLNVMDNNYWASSGGFAENGYLVLGAPRTFMLNVTVDF